MTPYKEACDEIIGFLEDLQGTLLELPEVVVGHWVEATTICKDRMPDWEQAVGLCNCMVAVLNRLQRSRADLSQVDGGQGQISILLGAMYLGQRDWTMASYQFERGARRLRERNHRALESLAYFGRALTHKQEKNWPIALEAAQKALDTIRDLPVNDKSARTKRLEKRIEREIEAITKASLRDTTTSVAMPIPIPIVSDIAAGEAIIVEENVEDYLFLDKDHLYGADFGVRIVGNSMRDAGILPGDIALIRQQPIVETGEIAAVVIKTLVGSEGVLKQYYLAYEDQPNLRHWFLRSHNPTSQHLVVIPGGANARAIRNLYYRLIRLGRMRNLIQYYMDAELIVAGKYVGLVREG
jgi:repressor LexA